GQTAAQGASVQCMQAIEIERSPGLPSSRVTTRRRLMPQGTSCSFLQAVTQALHSMQRSASQRNFIRAMVVAPLCCRDLAESDFWLLHAGRRIVSVGSDSIGAFAEHDRIGTLRIIAAKILACEPAAEVEGHPRDALADTLGNERFHPGARTVFGAGYPDPAAVLDVAIGGISRADLDEHVLLQFSKPRVGARFFATAL